MKHHKKSPRYSRSWNEIRKADTERFCGRCRKTTLWTYLPGFGHSACSLCHGRLGFSSEQSFEAHLARSRR